MKCYRVYWNITDGRRGYPNMPYPHGLDYYSGGHRAVRSYEDAIFAHYRAIQWPVGKAPRWRGRVTDVVETERGRTNGRNHRVFDVTYTAPDGSDPLTREVKVICWTV